MRWADAPIVSFSRNGQALELGRDGSAKLLHMQGSTGLSLAPFDLAMDDRITSDGSVVRGGRYTSREVYLPVAMMADSVGELTEARRDLTRLLAPHLGTVDIRIQDPVTGSDRTIPGYLTDGLTGTFDDTFRGVHQTLGLTFTCPEPWWLGPEQTRTLELNPGSKPFLSTTEPFFPVVLAESVVQDEWSIDIDGDAEVFPTWQITGPGTDLLIQSGDLKIFASGTFAAGTTTVIDSENWRWSPERWDTVATYSRPIPLQPGPNTVKVSMVGATVDTLVRLVWRERYLEGV
jgi:phage-related protein